MKKNIIRWVLVLRGLPASGKSGWIERHGLTCITYRRDARRADLFPGRAWSHEIAKALDADEAIGLGHLLLTNRLVISDGCHMDWDRTRAIMAGLKGPLIFKFVCFPLSVEESIIRQVLRPEAERVPASAIERMGSEFRAGRGMLDTIKPGEAWAFIKAKVPDLDLGGDA